MTHLTVEQVAKRLHYAPWTVRDLARRGELPHRRPPGRRRLLFPLRDLEAWEAGAELEQKRWGRDGRIVRPRKAS